jgi:hypothetical protein
MQTVSAMAVETGKEIANSKKGYIPFRHTQYFVTNT